MGLFKLGTRPSVALEIRIQGRLKRFQTASYCR
uniref:Uncharacterized protein n=1 Tax=Neisseria meningitidis alpha275 TaxID=295996 RepID=C6SIU3_NEIME|nr:hypothetical protein predicted by Glimmer/Critica [Neisseria meningitidis alpha275]